MASITSPIGYGLYVQQGINLLQVASLRLPTFAASLACANSIQQIAFKGVSGTLQFFGFYDSTFAQWVTKSVQWIQGSKDDVKSVRRGYSSSDDEIKETQKQEKTILRLLVDAVGFAVLGIVSQYLVNKAFGPAPEVYNNVLRWAGPIRISNETHPLIQILEQRFSS